MRAAAARRPRPAPRPRRPGEDTPPHPSGGPGEAPYLRPAPLRQLLRSDCERRGAGEGAWSAGAGRPGPRPHEPPANGAAGWSAGRPGSAARGGGPDGSFGSARGAGGSAGRGAGGGARPWALRGRRGLARPCSTLGRRTPLKSGGACAGASPDPPLQVWSKLTFGPESGRPRAPPSWRRERAPGTARRDEKRGRKKASQEPKRIKEGRKRKQKKKKGGKTVGEETEAQRSDTSLPPPGHSRSQQEEPLKASPVPDRGSAVFLLRLPTKKTPQGDRCPQARRRVLHREPNG